MTFLDWWGFAGTGIQSAFAWMGYNRDAFADNVGMRQNQKYQQKNYHISWIAIARDDIRDMMGISVNRINNYMIVATLILSVAAGAVTGASFNENCPTFVMFAFYLSIGISLVYLMLAIMFGVKGQNSAFTNTMKLLTYQVRPENPAEYSHDYMKQAQWIERNGMTGLFRIPGLMPAYNTDTQGDHAQSFKEKLEMLNKGVTPGTFAGLGGRKQPPKSTNVAAHDEGTGVPGGINLEDATPLESLVKRTTHTWYLTKFAQFMRLWQPYDTYSKYSMGLGIISLGQGSAYFSLGHLVSQGRYMSEWAACVLTFAFVYMVLLVVLQNFKARSPALRNAIFLLLTAGPCFGAIGAVTEYEGLKQLVVPLCFFCHFLFWLAAFFMALRELQDHKLDFVNSGWGFWGSSSGGEEDGGPQQATASSSREETTARPGQSARCIGKPQGVASQGEGARKFSAKSNMKEDAGSTCPSSATDHWPTDDEEFESKAHSTGVHIRQTVRYTLVTSAALWLAMFFWAAAKFWVDPLTLSAREAMGSPVGVTAEVFPVAWPGPLFRPKAVACAGGHVFAADGFRVFELFRDGSPAREVRCGLDAPLLGLSAACDTSSGCRPLALLEGRVGSRAAAEVVDCAVAGGGGAGAGAGAAAWPLLQDEELAEHFAVLPAEAGGDGGRVWPQNVTEHRLLTARGGEMVQFVWSEGQAGWAPEWSLGHVSFLADVAGARSGSEGLRAVGAAGGLLMLFRADIPQRPAVEARDLESMALSGRWLLPPDLAPLAGGCAWDEGSALVLPAAAASPDSIVGPRLVRVKLP